MFFYLFCKKHCCCVVLCYSKSADLRVLSKIYMSSSFGGSENKVEMGWTVGSVGTPTAHCRGDPVFGLPLINLFSPQRLHFKVTANQRRWAHAFMTGGKTATSSKSVRRRGEAGSDGYGTSPVTPKDSMLLGSELRARHARRSTGRRISESSDASGGALRRTVAGSPLEYRESGIPVRTSAMLMGRTDSTSSIPNAALVDGSLSSSVGGFYLNGTHRSRYSMCESDAGTVTWGWGGSGTDREWSAQPQSSMDWKSLAYPPSLPLTTDFFPDRRSLENDYVTSEYTLLPEDMCADLGTSPDREKVTAPLVYNQMVYQRLAQNFQIVLLPSKPATANVTATSLSSLGIQSRTSSSRKLTGGDTGSPSKQIVLSVGRVFHILSQSEPVVRVKSYSPRHPFPRTSYNYTYRFRVPDSPAGFDTSFTQFTCEPLELYRWNYVDQYLSTRGEDRTFRLQESLKYWRARFCLMHLDISGSKRLQAGASMYDRCDVFGFRNQYNHVLVIEGLMRFLETENKLKRVSTNSYGRRDSLMNLVYLAATRDPLSIFFNAVVDNHPEFLPSSSPATVMRNPMGDRTVENTEEPLVPESLASLSEIDPAELEERVARAVREVELGWDSWIDWRMMNWDSRRGRKWLTPRSDRADVIRCLTDPAEGLSFVETQPGSWCHQLPECCFISAEATLWAIRAVEGVDTLVTAIEYLQQLVNDGCIRHASGNKNLPFIFGFYLYFVVTGDRRPDSNIVLPLGYTVDQNFDCEWCEVAISENSCRSMPACIEMFIDGPPPARPTETSAYHPKCLRKEVSVDVDPGRVSSREVWGTARYHATFNPDSAFELTVEWLAASGPILGDLIGMWSRKANTNGLHFLPVPHDPFVLPDMPNADPLRAPIFVPLNVECLRDETGRDPLHDFPEETRSSRLLLLQFSILDLFGFIRDRPPTSGTVAGVSHMEWPQFIHCTGGMLVTVPQLEDLNSDTRDHDKLLYRNYIIRQCQFLGLGDVSDRLPAGFLWAWNFMLNKRWRNMVTGDEMLQDWMLSDVRRFCDGSDGRLLAHWQRARALSDAYKKFEQLRTGSRDEFSTEPNS